MKQKMIECVHEAAHEFRNSTSRMMSDTTKRTVSENAAIEAQLGKMSEKTAEVHRDNQSLRRYVTAQKHQVGALHSGTGSRPALLFTNTLRVRNWEF